MNAHNPLDPARRVECAGLARAHAEAITTQLMDGRSDLVTKKMLRDELAIALSKQTIRIGMPTPAIVTVATAILGILTSIK